MNDDMDQQTGPMGCIISLCGACREAEVVLGRNEARAQRWYASAVCGTTVFEYDQSKEFK